MSQDIDLSAEFDDDPASQAVLPDLSELYGADAAPSDEDFQHMLDVAMDPSTPAPDFDIPDPADLPADELNSEFPADEYAPDYIDNADHGQPDYHDDLIESQDHDAYAPDESSDDLNELDGGF